MISVELNHKIQKSRMGASITREALSQSSADELAAIVGDVGPAYNKYKDIIIENSVSGDVVLDMTDDDLDVVFKELGITLKLHCFKLKKELDAVKKNIGSDLSAPVSSPPPPGPSPSVKSPEAQAFEIDDLPITVEEGGSRICFGSYTKNGSRKQCVVKVARDPNEMADLRREVAVMQAISPSSSSSYSGCIRLSEHMDLHGLLNSKSYIVMERFGRSLFIWLHEHSKGKELKTVMCEEIIMGLLRAVQYMHGMGYMHGDIKPENILCHPDPGFVVKLCDLESSTLVGQPFPYAEQQGEGCGFKGTPDYRAPELLFGEPGQLLACVELDYFALGLVMWQIVQKRRRSLLHGLPVERLRELFSDQDTFDAEARFASVPSQLAEFVPCLRTFCSVDPSLRPAGFGQLPSTQSHTQLKMEGISRDRKLEDIHSAVIGVASALDEVAVDVRDIAVDVRDIAVDVRDIAVDGCWLVWSWTTLRWGW